MISQTAEYALRAVVYLSERRGERLTNGEIAKHTQIPAGYLAKVLQSLSRAGLVDSRRGLGGGFTVTRSSTEMTVLDVLDAVDPIMRIRKCPLGRPDHEHVMCPLHRALDQSLATIENGFRQTRIEDLMLEPNFTPKQAS